ncbi:MAG TPA: PAAR domain-containing protein [Methylocella sp.]|nr:PAAR domain-containing protein [Methylocella sp.]
MPGRPAARILDPVAHPIPGMLIPGPGSFNVIIGGKPAWRGVTAGAAAAIQAAKTTSDATIKAAEAATLAAAGTPAAPAAKVAEEGVKAAAAASMASMIAGVAGGADIHACMTPLPLPPHGPGVVIDGSPYVLINGLPACRKGDTIIEPVGPPDKITFGLPTVLIGDGNLALALALTHAGGSGTEEDRQLVAAELAKLPISVLNRMRANGTRVVACRNSITDYRTDLKGVQPRGWPPGSTWDSVPGANTPDRNEVVIATRGQGTPAGAHVPATGDGHGCANLVAHESMHSVDQGPNNPSASAEFNAARNADKSKLDSYENQPGAAGQEETYAESAARHAEGKDGSTPALKKYWDEHQ